MGLTDGPKWPAGCWALSRFQRNRSLEEMPREVGVEFGHEVNFLRPTKNELDPRKIEVGMIASLNSNSFDYKSNGFELGHGKRKVQKCWEFWWRFEKW